MQKCMANYTQVIKDIRLEMDEEKLSDNSNQTDDLVGDEIILQTISQSAPKHEESKK